MLRLRYLEWLSLVFSFTPALSRPVRWIHVSALATILAICCLPTAAPALEVRLEWDAPQVRTDGTPLGALSGYRIYRGNRPGEYSKVLDVAPQPSALMTDIEPGVDYFFSIAAVDEGGVEGVRSEELAWNSLDQEMDRIPDAWETKYWGSASAVDGRTESDADGDGQSDRDEYIAGTDPTRADSVARLLIDHLEGEVLIRFPIPAAEGLGYENMTRAHAVDRYNFARSEWEPCQGIATQLIAYPEIVIRAPRESFGLLRVRYNLQKSPAN